MHSSNIVPQPKNIEANIMIQILNFEANLQTVLYSVNRIILQFLIYQLISLATRASSDGEDKSRRKILRIDDDGDDNVNNHDSKRVALNDGDGCRHCQLTSLPSTCHLISGVFRRKRIPPGRLVITTIPRNACRINVTAVALGSGRIGEKSMLLKIFKIQEEIFVYAKK